MTQVVHRRRATSIDEVYSSCQTIPHPFFVPEADLLGHSSRTVRCIMLTWRLSTWIWPSLICAVTCAFKVRFSAGRYPLYLYLVSDYGIAFILQASQKTIPP